MRYIQIKAHIVIWIMCNSFIIRNSEICIFCYFAMYFYIFNAIREINFTHAHIFFLSLSSYSWKTDRVMYSIFDEMKSCIKDKIRKKELPRQFTSFVDNMKSMKNAKRMKKKIILAALIKYSIEEFCAFNVIWRKSGK